VPEVLVVTETEIERVLEHTPRSAAGGGGRFDPDVLSLDLPSAPGTVTRARVR
jgi:hypothetical protein